MPEKRTLQRAKEDKAEGKAPSTQAGEFVKEEIDHIREGKQGARSPRQAIAIGLSKARRAGVELAPPRKGSTSEGTRQRASRDLKKGHSGKAVRTDPRRRRSLQARQEGGGPTEGVMAPVGSDETFPGLQEVRNIASVSA